jgi:IS1 family transposase
MFEGLRKPKDLIVIVVTLLSYGCPIQAIVHAYALDERTVAAWRDRAGGHCQKVHQQLIEQGQLDLMHVQADEMRVKGCKMIAWMGLAMMVSTRLWIAGVVQSSRDRSLADRMMAQVRRCAACLHPLLVLTDGWSAYPGSIRRAFREKVKQTPGAGRACLQIWPQLSIGTVIKRTQNKRVVEITRRMAHGLLSQAELLLQESRGGTVLNTAFIERLNATFRQRLASLTRRSRHAARRIFALETGMYLIGCTYNFCFVHHELSKTRQVGSPCTPAMAAGLTDHVWSICELLSYRIAPLPWDSPTKRRQPRKPVESIKRTGVRPLDPYKNISHKYCRLASGVCGLSKAHEECDVWRVFRTHTKGVSEEHDAINGGIDGGSLVGRSRCQIEGFSNVWDNCQLVVSVVPVNVLIVIGNFRKYTGFIHPFPPCIGLPSVLKEIVRE